MSFEGHTRCPECHSWLKPHDTVSADGAMSSGWGEVNEHGQGLASLARSPEVPLPEFMTKPERKKKKKKKKLGPPPSAKVADQDIAWAFADEKPHLGIGRIISTGVLLLALVIGGWYLKPILEKQVEAYKNTETTLVLPEEGSTDPEVWLSGAKKSVNEENYPLAVAQYRRAWKLLKKQDAPTASVQEAKLFLAKTTFLNGDFEESHTLWSQLGKDNPRLAEESAAALKLADRELRKLAVSKLAQSRAALEEGELATAMALADKALTLNQEHGSLDQQVAQAHAMLGAIYLAEENSKVAMSHFAEAARLDPGGGYQQQLKSLGKGQPKKARSKTKKVIANPNFVPKDDTPKGKRVRVVPKRAANTKVEQPEQPVSRPKTKEIPAYVAPPGKKKKKRSSTDNAPPGYYK